MSNVIGAADFLVITNLYAQARERVLNQKDDLFDAVYQIVLLNTLYPEVDLLNPFWGVYQLNTNTTTSDENLLASVRALNFHILSRGNYTDINQYFVAHPGLKVDYTWSILSADAGYVINPQYINPP
jgi:hypothetical protein